MNSWRRYNVKAPWMNGAWMDAFAAGASVLCLAHCLVLPLLIAAMPAAASLLALPGWFHPAAFAMAVPASAFAMLAGYRRHGTLLPVLIGAVGLILLGAGVLLGLRLAAETAVTVTGSVLLAAGHLCNWRLRRSARCTILAPVPGDG